MNTPYENNIKATEKALNTLEAGFRKEYGYVIGSSTEDMSPNVFLERTDSNRLIIHGDLFKSDIDKLITILTKYRDDNQNL